MIESPPNAALARGTLAAATAVAQMGQLLREIGKPQLQPENLQDRAQGALDQAQNTAQNPADLKAMVSRALGQNGDVVKAADRDALINVIMNRTGKSRPEAEQS